VETDGRQAGGNVLTRRWRERGEVGKRVRNDDMTNNRLDRKALTENGGKEIKI
jgi:hypothetical protein